MTMVMEKAALACSQYPLIEDVLEMLQLRVRYHGAPPCECAASVVSFDDCAYMLKEYSAIRAMWMMALSGGQKTFMMNITVLVRRRNMDSTEMTTL